MFRVKDKSSGLTRHARCIAYEPIQAAFVIGPTVCADSVVPLDNLTTPFCEQCGKNY